MSSTPFKIYGKDTDFTFFEGEHHINSFENSQEVVIRSDNIKTGYLDADNVLWLVSDKKKIIISPEASFFHTFDNSIAPLIQQYELDKDVEIIIDIFKLENPEHSTNNTELNDDSFTGFFIKALRDCGIKVTTINQKKYDAININNFYVNDHQFYPGDTYSSMFNMFSEYVIDKDSNPDKKVYLSRKKVQSREFIYEDTDGNKVSIHESRIDDETVLERYFLSLGYEVIYPEEFKSFIDQLNYMYKVKTLVSLSSSGLTNAIFMQPNQTVVEIVTPLTIGLEDNTPYKSTLIEDLHHFYSTMAFKKRHKYVALNNQDKSASSIINQIENDPQLKQFLGSI
jgi:hypothetical protein